MLKRRAVLWSPSSLDLVCHSGGRARNHEAAPLSLWLHLCGARRERCRGVLRVSVSMADGTLMDEHGFEVPREVVSKYLSLQRGGHTASGAKP